MYEELVKTVRLCMGQPCCDNCPRYDNGLDPEECTKKLMLDCAEAIEKITSDYDDALCAIEALDGSNDMLHIENERLASKVDEQKKYISSLVETMMILDRNEEGEENG